MYLLDTDWCIQALGHREPAASTIRDLIGMPVSVGLVTVGEI